MQVSVKRDLANAKGNAVATYVRNISHKLTGWNKSTSSVGLPNGAAAFASGEVAHDYR